MLMMTTMRRRRHRAPCRFQAQAEDASHHHHVPKVHDFPSRPHERERVSGLAARHEPSHQPNGDMRVEQGVIRGGVEQNNNQLILVIQQENVHQWMMFWVQQEVYLSPPGL